ncbi:MAG: TlpA family protein disulfide reductase [Nitrospirae bacterium]|nr:TlpA family protein disulfide reductase [Nitrospirota bacterium]
MRRSSNETKKTGYMGQIRKDPVFYFIMTIVSLTVIVCALCPASAQPPSPYAIEKLVGQKAPDFTLTDLSGKPVSLSSFKGMPILLNFWAAWCPPCKAELPAISKLNQVMKDKGLVIIAVSTDREAADVIDFLKSVDVSFTVLIDYNITVSRNIYKVFMVPITFLIDKRGIIIERYFGEQNWAAPERIKAIEALL